ncbi:MAG: response regulator [Verrucomicrobia bacterium]|nr:response regulator [Verrucomicrobiota bacterium]
MNPRFQPTVPTEPVPGILVVDDEDIVRSALRETLRRERYEVVTMGSPLAALDALRRQPFSVVITDQQMPDLTGLELLAQVKELQPNATRILITAVLSLDTVIDAINKGEIFRFIVKPWLREELLATVKNAVQRYELIRSNARLQDETLAVNQRLLQSNQSLEEQVARVAEQNRQLADLNLALGKNLHRSVELCLHTMQTFYPRLGTQARRVFELCQAMGEATSLDPEPQRVLEVSAWLHDIGLVGVPRRLIRQWQEQPDSLNDAERAMIAQHPILGQELAGFVHHLSAVGEIIRAHHERFDGRGYPDRLAGERIPWLGRLLAVAVAYASSNEDAAHAIESIKAGAGAAFDPAAVDVFLKALPQAVEARKERQVTLLDLQPGMVLAKGIYAANGTLILPEGQRLSAAYIEKLLNHHRLHPISGSLLVYG